MRVDQNALPGSSPPVCPRPDVDIGIFVLQALSVFVVVLLDVVDSLFLVVRLRNCERLVGVIFGGFYCDAYSGESEGLGEGLVVDVVLEHLLFEVVDSVAFEVGVIADVFYVFGD